MNVSDGGARLGVGVGPLGLLAHPGLYAILDVDAWRRRGVELASEGVAEEIASAILEARPAALQLRAKSDHAAVTLALLRRLRPLARGAGVPLVANDRVDLALLGHADGVHVGRDDLAPDDVRRVAPGLRFGVSTHDEAQLADALRVSPAYVAFGPAFETSSKDRPDPVVGVERLAAAAATAANAGIPLVAIGGITRERARVLARNGARWVAVIGELVVARSPGVPDLPGVRARAIELVEACAGAAR